MIKIISATVLGLLFGAIGAKVYITDIKDHTDDLAIQIQYKYLNSYLLSNGTYEGIKSQHEAYLSYLETYKPNKYSTIPTEDALYMEKAVTLYRLAKLENTNRNIEAHNQYLNNAFEACKRFALVDDNCTVSMLESLSCIFNMTGKDLDCTPNKSLNQVGTNNLPPG